ncbi:MAG: hypothetical protein A2939_05525 [Parcubacteria group bacterium RIFCSPLOWO2_01_FULL_48_18]|nr:MAG: hypothetical protein A3J67_01070 [Parcubacteria group bacterium RIFCSPHIGHO2_02_FULL_48_10b]OHB22558.1 MAG: hypothetical protein A2939_05525 [Parcubacteria group bacterium RIFCSPLOWO2_01_FULL_48_18]
MGFSGEKYSKEVYEEAEEEARGAERSYQDRGTITGMSREAAQRIYDGLWENAAKARSRVERLYAKGQAEAIALNEQYERLRTQAQEAIKALADFEREKLGMHKEEPSSSSENGEN